MDWLSLGVYCGAFLLAYRRAYIAFDESHRREWPSLEVKGDDRAFFAFFAVMVAAFWPLCLVAWGFYKVLTPTTPGERRDVLKQRERDVARREFEIARLEREAGI